MNPDPLQEQLVEIQTRLVFQEDTIQALNQVVVSQDEQLRLLQQQLKLLGKRFDDYLYSEEQTQESPENEKPPHY